MRAKQIFWSEDAGWHGAADLDRDPALVLYFGSRDALACGARYAELRGRFPDARLVGCSTGGQINNDDVCDDTIVGVALWFDSTNLRLAFETDICADCSRVRGEAIGRALAGDDLAAIFVLSDGLNVNGSELVAGITAVVGKAVPLTGGLAGDGARFNETLVGSDCAPQSRSVAAIGFYGSSVKIGYGSAGGWDEFGPRRRITKSSGSVLYELDGEPALDLYERYLGEEAEGLPSTGLLFPLLIRNPKQTEEALVRTILAVDRDARSMTFAGDMPEGSIAQLMRGNFDRLTAGAAEAARQTQCSSNMESDTVALLVSCIGRRLLMDQRIVDEVEAVGAELGPNIPRLGFYSYGEISPHAISGACQLHNQTMTITTLAEATGAG